MNQCGALATGTYAGKDLLLECKKDAGHKPKDCHADDGFIWFEEQLPTTYPVTAE